MSHRPPQQPLEVGVGIDTHRYYYQAEFLYGDAQPAAPGLNFEESATGYAQLRQALEKIETRHPGVHFRIHLDAAGQYAANLEGYLRALPWHVTFSVGEPGRNKHYRQAIAPKRGKGDITDLPGVAHIAARSGENHRRHWRTDRRRARGQDRLHRPLRDQGEAGLLLRRVPRSEPVGQGQVRQPSGGGHDGNVAARKRSGASLPVDGGQVGRHAQSRRQSALRPSARRAAKGATWLMVTACASCCTWSSRFGRRTALSTATTIPGARRRRSQRKKKPRVANRTCLKSKRSPRLTPR
jgi:hypothetical protein